MSEIITATRDVKGRTRVHCPWVEVDLLVSVACRHCPKFGGELGDMLVVCSHSAVGVALDDVHRDITAPEFIEVDGEVIRLGGSRDGTRKTGR